MTTATMTALQKHHMVQELKKQTDGERTLIVAAALEVLRVRGRMTVGELAQRLGVSPGNITGLARNLAKAGRIRRWRSEEDNEDARKVYVEAL